MKLRNGNNQRNENTFQVGIMGIDFASEGPLSKKHKASYIFNYRYSTTGLLNVDLGGKMDYQDLNFKLSPYGALHYLTNIKAHSKRIRINGITWKMPDRDVLRSTWQPEVLPIATSLMKTRC